jgi:hypothetical protein
VSDGEGGGAGFMPDGLAVEQSMEVVGLGARPGESAT